MSFEMEGEAEDPFEEEDDEPVPLEEESEDQEPTGDEEIVVGTEVSSHEEQTRPEQETETEPRQAGELRSKEDDALRGTIADLDINDPVTPEKIAQALTAPEYSQEDPPVPYAVWRESTSTNRKTMSVEINPKLDDVVEQVAAEFKKRRGSDVYLSDVRELAMAYGLMHMEALFVMADEWGVEHEKNR